MSQRERLAPWYTLAGIRQRYFSLEPSSSNADMRNLYPGTTTLGCLNEFSHVRKVFIKICDSKALETIMFIIILVNCVFLAFVDPGNFPPWYTPTEYLFVILFTIESIIVIGARGLVFGKIAYLRSWWGVLDFAVVITGWVGLLVPGAPNLQGLRLVRALRPLKTLHRLDSPAFKAFKQSADSFFNAFVIVVFTLLLFCLVGQEMFSGALNHRCIDPDTGRQEPGDRLCGISSDFNGRQCPDGFLCVQIGDTPQYGTISFNNVGLAWVNLFRVFSMEGWSETMYRCDEALSKYSEWYFIASVIMVAFVLRNSVTAFMAVGIQARIKSVEERMRRIQHDEEMMLLNQGKAINVLGFGDDPRAKMKGVRVVRPGEEAAAAKQQREEQIELQRLRHQRELQQQRGLGFDTDSDNSDDDSDEEGAERGDKFGDDVDEVQSKPRLVACLEALGGSRWFEAFMVVIVILNSILISLNNYFASDQLRFNLLVINFGFSMVFLLEILVKVADLGWAKYLRSRINVLDVILTGFAILEAIGSGLGRETALSAFSALRFLRLYKLLRTWTPLRRVFSGLSRTISEIVPFFFMCLLIVYILATVGLHSFNQKLKETGADGVVRSQRANFDSFSWSCLTVFQLLTGESWADVAAEAVRGVGWVALPYFIATVLCGYYIITMLVAIMLGNFAEVDWSVERAFLAEGGDVEGAALEKELEGLPLLLHKTKSLYYYVFHCESDIHRREAREKQEADMLRMEAEERAREDKEFHESPFYEEVDKEGTVLEGTTCRCLDASSRVRIFLARLLTSLKAFYIPPLIILLSCFLMATDSPGVDSDSVWGGVVENSELVITILLFIEMVLKMVAYGVKGTKHSYFRKADHWLEFAVVVLGVANAFISRMTSVFNKDTIKTAKALLALRSMRLLTFASMTRRVTADIFNSLPQMISVGLLAGIIYYALGSMALQLFKGRFRRCETAFRVPVEPALSQTDCIAQGFFWENPVEANFDDITSSVRTLFEVASLDGWTTVVYLAIDATPAGEPPRINSFPPHAIFFVFVVMVCSIGLSALFVALVVDEYDRIAQQGTTAAKSDVSFLFLETYDQILESKPVFHSNALLELRDDLRRIVTGARFQGAMFAIAVINVLALCLHYYPAESQYTEAVQWLSDVCLGLLAIELVIKGLLLGSDFRHENPFNVFDATLISLSCFFWFLEEFSFTSWTVDLSAGRVLRLLTFLKYFRKGSLLDIFEAVREDLKRIGALVIVVFVFFYMYAIAGMRLFGTVRRGEFINDNANFETWPTAMMLLLRCASGEKWNNVLRDCQVEPPLCTLGVDCGDPRLALSFFVSFLSLTKFLLLNTFVAMMATTFMRRKRIAELPRIVTKAAIEELSARWKQVWEQQDFIAASHAMKKKQRLPENRSHYEMPIKMIREFEVVSEELDLGDERDADAAAADAAGAASPVGHRRSKRNSNKRTITVQPLNTLLNTLFSELIPNKDNNKRNSRELTWKEEKDKADAAAQEFEHMGEDDEFDSDAVRALLLDANKHDLQEREDNDQDLKVKAHIYQFLDEFDNHTMVGVAYKEFLETIQLPCIIPKDKLKVHLDGSAGSRSDKSGGLSEEQQARKSREARKNLSTHVHYFHIARFLCLHAYRRKFPNWSIEDLRRSEPDKLKAMERKEARVFPYAKLDSSWVFASRQVVVQSRRQRDREALERSARAADGGAVDGGVGGDEGTSNDPSRCIPEPFTVRLAGTGQAGGGKGRASLDGAPSNRKKKGKKTVTWALPFDTDEEEEDDDDGDRHAKKTGVSFESTQVEDEDSLSSRNSSDLDSLSDMDDALLPDIAFGVMGMDEGEGSGEFGEGEGGEGGKLTHDALAKHNQENPPMGELEASEEQQQQQTDQGNDSRACFGTFFL